MKTTLEQIRHEIANCRACPLSRNRTNTVPGVGNPQARIVLVGEGPGAREDQSGQPFTGLAGKLLDRMLLNAGIARNELFIINIVKCRPPGNATPQPDSIAACRPHLENQLETINPALIIAAGKPAAQWFLPDEPIAKITDHAGILRKTAEGRHLYPVIHPAAGRRSDAMKNLTERHLLFVPGLLAMLESNAEAA